MTLQNKQNSNLPYKISVLIFIRNEKGELLFIQRGNHPNKGLLSPIGGKLEMGIGESPFECAKREVKEEVDFDIETSDLHLFCMVNEKNYEDKCHWLMFLFDCKKTINYLPKQIDEGSFCFHSYDDIDKLKIPQTDKDILWSYWKNAREGFSCLNINCACDGILTPKIEQKL